MRRTILVSSAVTALLLGPATAQAPQLGKKPDAALLKAWDIDVSPDGAGLPVGHGSVEEGAKIYEAKCAACHGESAIGGPADRLSGGVGTLTSAHPVKTVSSYWPYATTLFGFIRASMPITDPRSLSAHETYALCAYLLSIDGIIPKDVVLDAKSLPTIVMPNRGGFKSMWDKEKENFR
jgi:cytochrome c